ncbi:MAG: HAMP domain-containing histidine kinase [Myxococcales bacterium]|nr:HAMP domain-containing histidine kinase [Myxococcales bacterium]
MTREGRWIDLSQLGGAVLACTFAGVVEIATPEAAGLLGRCAREASLMPGPLTRRLFAVEAGQAISWRPDNDPEFCIGCTWYPLGPNRALVLMREVSGKQEDISRRLQRQRWESIGRLVSGIAHDLGAPLASVMFNAAVLHERLDRLSPTDVAELVSDIRTAASRMREFMHGLLDYATGTSSSFRNVSLAVVLERVNGLLRPMLRRGNHTVRTRLDPDLDEVRGNPLLIEQILLNLLANAVQSSERSVNVTITTASAASDEAVEIAVTDDGEGIGDEIAEQIFEPFFSTKASGTGIGLTIAREAARDMGGDLRLDTSHRVGTRFVIKLLSARAKAA